MLEGCSSIQQQPGFLKNCTNLGVENETVGKGATFNFYKWRKIAHMNDKKGKKLDKTQIMKIWSPKERRYCINQHSKLQISELIIIVNQDVETYKTKQIAIADTGNEKRNLDKKKKGWKYRWKRAYKKWEIVFKLVRLILFLYCYVHHPSCCNHFIYRTKLLRSFCITTRAFRPVYKTTIHKKIIIIFTCTKPIVSSFETKLHC